MPYVGLFFVWVGVIFSTVGVIGLFRFPDVFTRIHSAGKVATLGVAFLIFGTIIFVPEIFLKGIVLISFLILSAPVSAHSIGIAAHRNFTRIQVGERDDLADARQRTGEADTQDIPPDVARDMPDDAVDQTMT